MKFMRKFVSNDGKPRRLRATTAILLPATLIMMGADKGCVSKPTVDTIVTTSPIEVKGGIQYIDSTGNVTLQDGKAQLRVNASWLAEVSTADQVWTYPAVALQNGVNTLDGKTRRWNGLFWVNGVIDPFLLERRNDIPSTGQQKVWFNMTHFNINNQLTAIANHTLNGPLSAADLNTFTTGVRAGIKDFVLKAYSGVDIVEVFAAGPDVQEIQFHGENSCSLYGQSPGDFKNQIKAQVSHIYVGTFKCVVVDDDKLLTETPAKKTDTLQTRITDISTFIGRTAAHEFGHSLGLVAEGNAQLKGCEGMHSCEAYDAANPSDRFDSGHYIMDPGPKSTLHARIGQADPVNRDPQKPRFCNYDRSYLKIILPL
jgi:hypothetical protein